MFHSFIQGNIKHMEGKINEYEVISNYISYNAVQWKEKRIFTLTMFRISFHLCVVGASVLGCQQYSVSIVESICPLSASPKEMSWWNLSTRSSLTSPRFLGRKSEWGWGKCMFSDILQFKHFLNQLSVVQYLCVPRKISTTNLNGSYAFLSLPSRTSSKFLSFVMSFIWGPTKIT
jgi:hypothetical protein